jgi:putative redox protein
MVEFQISYQGELRCEAVHGPSSAQLHTDAPTDNMGRGETFSPTDLTCVSLATCMLTTMAIGAKKKGLDIALEGARAHVVKHMTDQAPRCIAKIQVEITVPQPADHPERASVEGWALTCPVALSLHPDVEKVVSFQWVG